MKLNFVFTSCRPLCRSGSIIAIAGDDVLVCSWYIFEHLRVVLLLRLGLREGMYDLGRKDLCARSRYIPISHPAAAAICPS